MTTISLDDKSLAPLLATKEMVAVSDGAGKVIGFFAPVMQVYADQYAEMAARAYSVWGPDGRPKDLTTSAEVIAYLENRESKK